MKHKNIFLPLLFVIGILLAGSFTQAKAQGRFGIGFVFGEPTGFDWKYRISEDNALAGAIGFTGSDRTRVDVDYLWQSYPFYERDLSVHYGIGAAMGFGNETRDDFFRQNDLGFGVRGVIGLTYMIPRSPVDVFVEAAPVMVFSPPTGVNLDAGLGVRFYPR